MQRIVVKFLPTFRDNLSTPTSRVKNPFWLCGFLSLEDGTDRLSRNVGTGLHCSLRNNPEESNSHPLRGGSLKSRVAYKRPFHFSFCWYSSHLRWVLHIPPIAFSLMLAPQIIKLLVKRCYSHPLFTSLKYKYSPQQGQCLRKCLRFSRYTRTCEFTALYHQQCVQCV